MRSISNKLNLSQTRPAIGRSKSTEDLQAGNSGGHKKASVSSDANHPFRCVKFTEPKADKTQVNAPVEVFASTPRGERKTTKIASELRNECIRDMVKRFDVEQIEGKKMGNDFAQQVMELLPSELANLFKVGGPIDAGKVAETLDIFLNGLRDRSSELGLPKIGAELIQASLWKIAEVLIDQGSTLESQLDSSYLAFKNDSGYEVLKKAQAKPKNIAANDHWMKELGISKGQARRAEALQMIVRKLMNGFVDRELSSLPVIRALEAEFEQAFHGEVFAGNGIKNPFKMAVWDALTQAIDRKLFDDIERFERPVGLPRPSERIVPKTEKKFRRRNPKTEQMDIKTRNHSSIIKAQPRPVKEASPRAIHRSQSAGNLQTTHSVKQKTRTLPRRQRNPPTVVAPSQHIAAPTIPGNPLALNMVAVQPRPDDTPEIPRGTAIGPDQRQALPARSDGGDGTPNHPPQ